MAKSAVRATFSSTTTSQAVAQSCIMAFAQVAGGIRSLVLREVVRHMPLATCHLPLATFNEPLVRETMTKAMAGLAHGFGQPARVFIYARADWPKPRLRPAM